MGFQQQVLDQLFIAFLSALLSLLVVIPANLAGIYFPYVGCMLNFLGASYVFYLLYKYFYQKKFTSINPPIVYGWWIYLSLSFAITFSSPIIVREAWFTINSQLIFILIPLLAYILFEIYSFRLSVKNWIES